VSHENVEIVRGVVDHYNASGDLPWEMIDAQVEWNVGPPWLAGTYTGHDGVRAFFGQIAEAFDRFQLEVDRYFDAGDAVVALGRTRAHGVRSDVTTGQAFAMVFGISDGRVVTATSYPGPEQALEAARLRE
jgi:ketosteroid isomerase-like protein